MCAKQVSGPAKGSKSKVPAAKEAGKGSKAIKAGKVEEESEQETALAKVNLDPSLGLAGMHQSDVTVEFNPAESQVMTCKCGKIHFRHTGNICTMSPIKLPSIPTMSETSSHMVQTCVSCRRSYVFIGGQIQEVTKHIDLQAWEKFEKKAHKATGPGGQC